MPDKIILTNSKRGELRAKISEKLLTLKDMQLINLINNLGCKLDLQDNDFEVAPFRLQDRRR